MYEALTDVTGVTERKADQLLEEYANLTTISWATRHDREYIRDEVRVNLDFLRGQLQDEGLYRYHRQHKGELAAGIPERREEYLDRVFPVQAELEDYDDGGWQYDG